MIIFQVYLTIFLALVLTTGVLVAVFGRPFLRRWREETRLETEQRERERAEQKHRDAAKREVEAWCGEVEASTPPEQASADPGSPHAHRDGQEQKTK